MKNLNELFFGTPGIPLSTVPRDTANGIAEVKRLGLSAMELEFVQTVYVKEDAAPKILEAAKKNNVILTCHGQYFINLNAQEEKKVEASKQRIYTAAKRAFQCGAWSMCFHPGYYMGQSPEHVYKKIKANLSSVASKLKNEGIEIWVRPEVTGKPSQFGSMEELISLSLEIENVLPCIDFSHLYTRSLGKFNTFEDFKSTLAKVESGLGKEALQKMHIHAQGASFNRTGEKAHLAFSESGFNYKALVKALKEFSAKGVLICESPAVEKDTLLIQKAYNNA